MKHYVGIDVGGTRIKAGLVNALHKVIREEVIWLEPAHKTEEGMLKLLAEVVPRLLAGITPVVVGLGLPGIVSRWTGEVVRSPNFPAWKNFKLKERLEPMIGLHVVMDNDANCVIAGEFLQGAGAGHNELIGLTLGTGVGGGIILHGSLWRGAKGMAGELGHIPVDPLGPKCGCGASGCLEQYASSVGLRRLCKKTPVDGVNIKDADFPEQLARAARGGDTTATAHFTVAGTMLGRGLATLLNIFDIRSVLLCGGLAPTWDLMETAARAEMNRVAYQEIAHDVQVMVGTLGEKAGILGAAMQWMMAPHD